MQDEARKMKLHFPPKHSPKPLQDHPKPEPKIKRITVEGK